MPWGVIRKRVGMWGEAWLLWAGRRMSLPFKLALPVLVSTVGLVAVMGTIVANAVQAQIDLAYDQQAQVVAAGVEAMFLQHPDNMPEMNDYLTGLAATRPDIIAIRILGVDRDTTVIASSQAKEVGMTGIADPAERRAVLGGYRFQDLGDGPVLTTVYPLRDVAGMLFGAIVITSSKSAELAAARSIVQTIAIVGAVAIAIDSLMVLSALYLGILRRTRRIQRAVEAVGAGDTRTRLTEADEPPGRDELFNLARSVSHTIEALDERKRGDDLIRNLTQRALAGTDLSILVAEALQATRRALGLSSCMYVTFGQDWSLGMWMDGEGPARGARSLPVWVVALARVAVEARRSVITDRFGQRSDFAGGAPVASDAQAVVVPLPRTSKSGQAIVAVAAEGETIPEGGLAVLDAVAATIAEMMHMQDAEAARAESAVKSKVMSAVSHEMRNPLNSILGFTGLLLGSTGDDLTEKQRRQLGFVQTSATNMLNLVNNYLDLAKVRAGTVVVQYETVPLASVVAEVVGAMQPIAAKRNVSVRVAVDALAQARTDPTRVRQILTNLLSNAVKFTPDGGRVYVRARVDRDTWRLVVSDTGVGIPKDQVNLVFTEFSKIDAGRLAANKGTGLGLALTRAFVNTLGGSIKFYTRAGRGTTFVVTLPRDGDGGAKKAA